MNKMSICYNKLWKLLIDKKMSQADFRRTADISYSTLSKLRKDEIVSLEILLKICGLLDCNVGDVLDFVKTETTESEMTESDAAPKPNRRVRKK